MKIRTALSLIFITVFTTANPVYSKSSTTSGDVKKLEARHEKIIKEHDKLMKSNYQLSAAKQSIQALEKDLAKSEKKLKKTEDKIISTEFIANWQLGDNIKSAAKLRIEIYEIKEDLVKAQEHQKKIKTILEETIKVEIDKITNKINAAEKENQETSKTMTQLEKESDVQKEIASLQKLIDANNNFITDGNAYLMNFNNFLTQGKFIGLRANILEMKLQNHLKDTLIGRYINAKLKKIMPQICKLRKSCDKPEELNELINKLINEPIQTEDDFINKNSSVKETMEARTGEKKTSEGETK